MDFQNKLAALLVNALGANTDCHLETSTSGRVGGIVISPAFSGKSQHERQELLWDELRVRLSKAEANNILALLTLTPDELSDLDEEAAEPM
ncbi:MAG: hypothetical protein AMXMBFR64_41740 [Myxococcales bacterium]